MSSIQSLERRFGGRWTGIRFHHGEFAKDRLAQRPMRFCEAVALSRTGPVTLVPELVSCPGALFSMGWADDIERITGEMAAESGIPENILASIIQASPRLPPGFSAVTVGTYGEADAALTFAQPKAAMNVVRNWQTAYGKPMGAQISCFMGVCGAVAARTHVNHELSLSFGCPHSRSAAGITRDRLVLGVPAVMFEVLATGVPVESRSRDRRAMAAQIRSNSNLGQAPDGKWKEARTQEANT